MDLLAYRRFPKQMRQIASNVWVRELMYRLNVTTISELICSLESIEGRKLYTLSEKKSCFWYHILKKRAVTWTHKINDIEAHFPETQSILGSVFWHFILYMKLTNIKPKSSQEHSRYIGPQVNDKHLLATAKKYVKRSVCNPLTDEELERIHSVHGLSALIVALFQAKYEGENTDIYLLAISRTFLITFALRYQTDYVWDIFKLLQLNLSDDAALQHPSLVSEVHHEDGLYERLNKIRADTRELVCMNDVEKNDRAKLIYIARNLNC